MVAALLSVPTDGTDRLDLAVHVPDVRAWSPDAPDLYAVTVALRRDGVVVDRRTERCGFRTFETRDGLFLLNGRPFHMRAALD